MNKLSKRLFADLPIEIKSFGFWHDGELVNLVNCCRRSIYCANLPRPCCMGDNEDCSNNQCPNNECHNTKACREAGGKQDA